MFRAIRGCTTVALLAFIVFVIAVAYLALHRAPTPAPAVQPLTAATPVSVQASSPTTPGALDARVASAEAQIRQDAAAGKHAPVSFTISDAEMTARVNQALTSGEVKAPVSGVQVSSRPGAIVIRGQAHASVISAPFTMTAVPRVNAGRAQLQVSSIDFGGLPVPSSLSSRLTSAVSSQNLLGNLPLTVTSFRAEQGGVVLDGHT